MSRPVNALAAALLLALPLAGCSSDSSTSDASTSAAASPTPTPTPAPVVWAGEVCVERDNLEASVGALGRNLSYDVTSDASALDQIDRQLRIQVLAVADAADGLSTALQGVPVDFVAANDFVVSATKAKDDTSEAIAEVGARLDAAGSAGNVLAAGAEIAQALVAGKAAFEAGSTLVSVVSDAASGANTELRAAFDAAPACQAS